jgi:hypothetical protein
MTFEGWLLACCIDRGDCGYAGFGISFEEAGHTLGATFGNGHEVMPDEFPQSFVHIQDVSWSQSVHCLLDLLDEPLSPLGATDRSALRMWPPEGEVPSLEKALAPSI